MNILVVGSGKNACHVALELVAAHHEVAVLCETKEAANALADSDFSGSVTLGIATDLDSLKAAGIEDCDALVSCTDDDNTNIMVSEIAREFFNLYKIVTRIVDVSREDTYQRYGLETICSARLVSNAIVSALSPEYQSRQTVQFGTNTLGFELRQVNDLMEGRYVDELKIPESHTVIGIMHSDSRITLLKNERLKMQEGDHLLIARTVD